MSTPTGPTDQEERRWAAERIVEKQFRDSPEFKAAVKATMAALETAENVAGSALTGKGTGGGQKGPPRAAQAPAAPKTATVPTGAREVAAHGGAKVIYRDG